MKKIFNEFKTFINKGNALSLAIGVILGAAFTSIVTTINTKIISPLIGTLLGDNNLNESLVTVLKTTEDPVTKEVTVTNAIYWGAFIQSIIDFLLTAIILFAIFKISGHFASTLKKAQDREAWVSIKMEKGYKLREKEKIIAEKILKDREEQLRKEEEEKNKPIEPTFEEKQLALLESINNALIGYNKK